MNHSILCCQMLYLNNVITYRLFNNMYRFATLRPLIRHPNTIIYQETLAANMIQLCVSAYQFGKNNQIQPTFYPGFKFIKTIFDQSSQKCSLVMAYVGLDQSRKSIVFCARGTKNLVNILDDMDIDLVDFKLKSGVYKVHHGFKISYDILLQQYFTKAVDELVKQYPTHNVIYTGHSLGGAIAQMAAVQHKDNSSDERLNVQIITCGQPRVGNKQFADHVDNLVPQNFRIVNKEDRVPHIPKQLKLIQYYKHAGYEIWYKDGTDKPYGVFKSESKNGSQSTSILTRQIKDHRSAEYNKIKEKTEFKDANMSTAIN